jgi:hypothetical protein
MVLDFSLKIESGRIFAFLKNSELKKSEFFNPPILMPCAEKFLILDSSIYFKACIKRYLKCML